MHWLIFPAKSPFHNISRSPSLNHIVVNCSFHSTPPSIPISTIRFRPRLTTLRFHRHPEIRLSSRFQHRIATAPVDAGDQHSTHTLPSLPATDWHRSRSPTLHLKNRRFAARPQNCFLPSSPGVAADHSFHLVTACVDT